APLSLSPGPSPAVPCGGSTGALIELRGGAKTRHIGLSNVTVPQLREARRITPIVSVQNRYNHADRSSDPVLEACEQDELAFLPWAPIQDHESNRGVQEVARRHGATVHQVAL